MPARLKISVPIDVATFLLDQELGFTTDGQRVVDGIAETAARRLTRADGSSCQGWKGWRWETTDRILNFNKWERYRQRGDRHCVPFLIVGALVRDDA